MDVAISTTVRDPKFEADFALWGRLSKPAADREPSWSRTWFLPGSGLAGSTHNAGEDEESRARNATSKWRSSLPHWDEWLTGLTPFRQREAVWRSLAHRILARPESPHPRDAGEALQLLGELVAGF